MIRYILIIIMMVMGAYMMERSWETLEEIKQKQDSRYIDLCKKRGLRGCKR